MAKGFAKALAGILVLGAIAAGGFYYWLDKETKPVAKGKPQYVRYDDKQSLKIVLKDLQNRGIIRNAQAAGLYARLKGADEAIRSGTYLIEPGLTLPVLFNVLKKPLRQMVRLPETNWANRSANLLEGKEVTEADEYMILVKQPEEFKDLVSFPLPKESLEGYLYPDTYDLPPMLGARGVIERQLKNFETRVWKGMDQPENLHRLVTVASMVELEVAKDEERPMVAGVIENRLRIGMPLQIDATLLYGIQKWRRLTFRDYREIDSPYNTYTHKGLPPGPICSPTVKSIEAAMKPAKHNFLYYVAMPGGNHLFSATYGEHLANIRKRNRAYASLEASK